LALGVARRPEARDQARRVVAGGLREGGDPDDSGRGHGCVSRLFQRVSSVEGAGVPRVALPQILLGVGWVSLAERGATHQTDAELVGCASLREADPPYRDQSKARMS